MNVLEELSRLTVVSYKEWSESVDADPEIVVVELAKEYENEKTD